MTQQMSYANTFKVVSVSAIAIIISVVLALFGPQSISNLASVPAIGGLFWALLEISRDRIAHDRAIFLLDAQNKFAIGATSHMANVAFDKHVEFCERYAEETTRTLTALFREGPTQNALNHAASLADIRVKATLWLNPELETKLGQLEGAISGIGAKAYLIDAIHGDAGRPAVVAEMYAQFAQVIGLKKWDDKPVPEDLALRKVIEKLREILGIDELTTLRTELVSRALGK